MCRAVLTTLFVGFAFAPAGPDDKDTAKAIVARALKATGGEALARKARAVHFKMKGKIAEPPNTLFSGESFEEYPERFKITVHQDVAGGVISTTEVLDGDKTWSRTNLEAPTDDKSLLEYRKESAYVQQVTSLYPLLEGSVFTLTQLGDTKVQDRIAAGVKVSAKGRPDVKLYFDKGSGLLVKWGYTFKEPMSGKLVLREELLSDYREVDSPAADEKTLRDAKVGTDGPSLLEYLRARTFDEARRSGIKPLVRDLGDPAFEVRDKAQKQLIALGAAAMPVLSEAQKDSDPEIANRARECIEKIRKAKDQNLARAVIHVLIHRKPAGAASAVLDYLSSAPDEETRQEAEAALAVLAFANNQPDKVLVDALEDKDPVRRAAAALALGKSSEKGRAKPGRRVFLLGFKLPMKGMAYDDGTMYMEWELSDVQFFNAFSDATFAKPK